MYELITQQLTSVHEKSVVCKIFHSPFNEFGNADDINKLYKEVNIKYMKCTHVF